MWRIAAARLAPAGDRIIPRASRRLAPRTPFERIEGVSATRGEREMPLPRIGLRSCPRHEPPFLECAEHAAEIAGIEVQRACDVRRGWLLE